MSSAMGAGHYRIKNYLFSSHAHENSTRLDVNLVLYEHLMGHICSVRYAILSFIICPALYVALRCQQYYVVYADAVSVDVNECGSVAHLLYVVYVC
jgi:hypothetical protein